MKKAAYKNVFLVLIAIFILAWLGIRYLLPVTLPFLLGLAIAGLAEPAVRFLEKRLRLPRWLATGIAVTALLALLLLALYGVGLAAYRELNNLASELPALLESASKPLAQFKGWLLHLADSAPESLRGPILTAINTAFASGDTIAVRASSGAMNFATSIIGSLPGWLLFAGTGILASFMISGQLPKFRPWLQARIPAQWKKQLLPAITNLKNAVTGWFKAQAKLMGITFCIVTAGLCLLRINVPLLAGAVIALVDALPMLGTGTILIPWGLLCFLQGKPGIGTGLIVLYGVSALVRAAMEPRIVGNQLGLNPLLTMLAIYAGFQFWGVLGMLLAPMLVIAAQEICTLLQPKPQF